MYVYQLKGRCEAIRVREKGLQGVCVLGTLHSHINRMVRQVLCTYWMKLRTPRLPELTKATSRP